MARCPFRVLPADRSSSRALGVGAADGCRHVRPGAISLTIGMVPMLDALTR